VRPGSVTEAVDGALSTLAALEAHGIALAEVTDTLLREGLAAFELSFVTLLAGLRAKRAALAGA
jgi:hypothetical protein